MALEKALCGQELLSEVPPQTLMVSSLSLMVAAKHRPTYLHLCDVALYTEALARRLKLDSNQIKLAGTAGLLHDIGKVAIPLEILTKPGRLTDREKAIMDEHPALGTQIAARNGAGQELCDAIQYHHECYGGGGYPANLRGSEIPLVCRMISIADAFDSMTSRRPYRKAISTEAALGELERCRGSQFDPELAAEFIAMIRHPDPTVRSTYHIHRRNAKHLPV